MAAEQCLDWARAKEETDRLGRYCLIQWEMTTALNWMGMRSGGSKGRGGTCFGVKALGYDDGWGGG